MHLSLYLSSPLLLVSCALSTFSLLLNSRATTSKCQTEGVVYWLIHGVPCVCRCYIV
uniref:Uncharacterized protein n=1 Tax=Arundo donax TaxID=35708 RepID=A0A0A9GZU2_ARUDO